MNSFGDIDLGVIDRMTGGRMGRHDVACLLCGPTKSTSGQRRKVMRVWRIEPGFATYYCARCGEAGYAHDRRTAPPDPERLAKAKAEAAEIDRVHKADRLHKARWLWSRRQPIARTVGERYLRDKRGITCPLTKCDGILPRRRTARCSPW